MTTSKRLTIFEGCDGSGKSTAAKAYAAATGARYVHSGPFPGVGDHALGRLYVEAMLPALLGYQDVVMDRCWVSETIYGSVYRQHDRLAIGTRLLDRLAWRCGAVLVHCHPAYEVVRDNWAARRGDELLKREDQLRRVYMSYAAGVDLVPLGHLNTAYHDYTKGDLKVDYVEMMRPPSHPLANRTAGNIGARVLLVGDQFTSVTNADTAYQWPFASFSGGGCSRWLAMQLENEDLGEDRLLWANADMDLPAILNYALSPRHVVALGEAAADALAKAGVRDFFRVDHPQFHKRFKSREIYPLIHLLKELLK